MSYTKQPWRDGMTDYTPLTADRMNHIEDGIKDISDAQHSISRVEICKDMIATKYGRIVWLNYQITAELSVSFKTIGTLPEGYRPIDHVYDSAGANSGDVNGVIYISPAGLVQARSSTASGSMIGSTVFIAAI